MHGKIALLQLFQKHYSFLSNDAFLTENFDDFSHLLLKNSFFKKKTSFYIFLLEIRILMERMAILMTFIMLYKKFRRV